MGRYKYNVNRYIFLDLVSSTAKKCTIQLAQLLCSAPIPKKKKKKPPLLSCPYSNKRCGIFSRAVTLPTIFGSNYKFLFAIGTFLASLLTIGWKLIVGTL